LKTESLRLVPLAKKNGLPAKLGAPAARPFGPPVKPGPSPVASGPATGKSPVAGEDRRRSQRVMLRVRANLHVVLHGKPSTFEVVTLSVNHHGAIVVVERNLSAGTLLVLEHGQTRERVACKVVRAAREMPGGFQVPIEFDSPAPDFWKIAFPPADWRPNEP
jgi:hypothetical protein